MLFCIWDILQLTCSDQNGGKCEVLNKESVIQAGVHIWSVVIRT